MPNRWPISSGNWSDSAIWSGSLIPTASDDVFLNNQTVTLDQTITVRSIRNTATGSAVVGGLLNIYTDYNIECTTTQSVSAGGLDSNGATVTSGYVKYYNSGSITITAHLVSARSTLENVNNGTINIVGDVRIPITPTTSQRTVTNSSNGTISIVGNVIPGGNTTANNTGVFNSSNGSIIVVGNVAGGNNNSAPIGIVNNANGTVTITGNVAGGTGNSITNAYGILNNSTGIINVTGNIVGGEGGGATNPTGISNNSIGTVNITGNVIAGTSTNSRGILSSTAGIINVIGQLQSTTQNNAVISTSTTATNVFSGPLINSGSRNAIYCYNVELYKNAITSYQIGITGSANTTTLYSDPPGMPIVTNVRSGVIYGLTNTLTGSMAVPNSRSVSIGVAVDNPPTVGVAMTTAADLWNYAVTAMTASNSIGQRLANVATSASNAAITNAFG